MSQLVVVAGVVANKPRHGGEAWVRMSYVRGLRRLGLDVAFVEQIDRERAGPEALAAFASVVDRFGLTGAAALVDETGAPLAGLAAEELAELAGRAELLVNVSGNLRAPSLLDRFRRRAYIDLDPGYTQAWHVQGMAPLAGHDAWFTVGANVGRPGCPVPVDGIRWRPTRPPVVLDDWEPAEGGLDRFTTVAAWRGAFGALEHEGRRFGRKAHEFRRIAGLPRLAEGPFELALEIHPGDDADRELLERSGWLLVDPVAASGTPEAFRDYVRGSGAELSVAQGVYVETRCGWFSDRSTRYLAAGRPVLVQDTGFRDELPVGEGLLVFSTLEEAVAGARAIAADYERHRRAARAVAEECFHSDAVLTRLLEDAGA